MGVVESPDGARPSLGSCILCSNTRYLPTLRTHLPLLILNSLNHKMASLCLALSLSLLLLLHMCLGASLRHRRWPGFKAKLEFINLYQGVRLSCLCYRWEFLTSLWGIYVQYKVYDLETLLGIIDASGKMTNRHAWPRQAVLHRRPPP
jgi:hypothetical protein